ncbi:MAG: DUF2231 domain-containing protein [Armatimonadetes bacterium]|nr:DUF2231 domain-containing protein [Armatimonadota bacterium]
MEEKLEKLLQGDQWLGHPVHPSLVALPIGMWCLGATLDFLSLFTKNKCIQEAADHAVTAGLVGAALAATTGLGEFMRVPPDEHIQQTALTHAAANVSAVAVNSINAIIRNGRRGAGRPGGFIPKLLSLAGIGLVTYSGWLGGLMVYRYGAAVNIEKETRESTERAQREEQQPRVAQEEPKAEGRTRPRRGARAGVS